MHSDRETKHIFIYRTNRIKQRLGKPSPKKSSSFRKRKNIQSLHGKVTETEFTDEQRTITKLRENIFFMIRIMFLC